MWFCFFHFPKGMLTEGRFYLKVKIRSTMSRQNTTEMLSNDVHVGCIVWSGLSCLPASRPGQPLIFRAARRPVVSGNLGRLVCSLIDGLSVWSNYRGPAGEQGDFVDCCVHTEVDEPETWHPHVGITLTIVVASKSFISNGFSSWHELFFLPANKLLGYSVKGLPVTAGVNWSFTSWFLH